MDGYKINVEFVKETKQGFEILVRCINRDNGEFQKVSLLVPEIFHEVRVSDDRLLESKEKSME